MSTNSLLSRPAAVSAVLEGRHFSQSSLANLMLNMVG